jgi:hypothetical protein
MQLGESLADKLPIDGARAQPRLGLMGVPSAMRNFSGRSGAKTLSTTVYYASCIKIGDRIFIKRTLNFFRLLLGGPSRIPVNTYQI